MRYREFIYELVGKNGVFYVGRTVDPEARLKQHCRWLSEVDGGFSMRLVTVVYSPEDASFEEGRLILEYFKAGLSLKNAHVPLGAWGKKVKNREKRISRTEARIFQMELKERRKARLAAQKEAVEKMKRTKGPR